MSLTSDHHRHLFEESPCEYSDAICSLCKDKVSFQPLAYYCHTCRSSFHKDCLTITYAKTHEHTLTYIRRHMSVVCNVCGLRGMNDYIDVGIYGCLQCDFFVHKKCIYLPKVIKITRHQHCLFHFHVLSLSGLSDGHIICGVCRKTAAVRYGGYSCIGKRCNYVIHSDCLIRFNVWDGKDLEGEPEPEEIDSEADIAALVEIDGKSKRHFSHHHNLLRLHVDGQEEALLCQACILPIEFGSFLGCKKCNFALHQVCASLPIKMEHPIHRHPLFIHVDTMNIESGFFTCSACNQHSCGFMYKCSQEDCGFNIDVKCASFAQPFNHSAHEHPLYLSIYYDQFIDRCVGCYRYSGYAANCNKCYFRLEFKCLNLPKLVKYKCDTHPLTLTLYYDKNIPRASYKIRGLDTKGDELYRQRIMEPLGWWCEICEKNINKNEFRYTCDDCCTTLHVDCILGKYPNLKSGHRIKVSDFEVEIASNGVSRPICHTCRCICQDKLVFKGRYDDVCFCSFECIPSTS